MIKGGRAARSRESAYQRLAAPAAKTKGVMQAAMMAMNRGHAVIHALARPPPKASSKAAIGSRTRISLADSKEFLTTNAPGSVMPLAKKAS